jgi:prepilin-type N-terminal cleavage/methylation domain-containing protein
VRRHIAAACRGHGRATVRAARRSCRGFTLIELLVVLIVVGVVVASIQLNLFSDDARRLRNEGERLAALLTALADESVTSGMRRWRCRSAMTATRSGNVMKSRRPKTDDR